MAPATVATVLATIREAEQNFNCSVGLVIFDTFAKLIAAGGGDEDKARDQGATFSNIQRVKDGADVHVAIVGHTGKDEKRGARGSNAILGDTDVMVSITGEGDAVRTASITKANDSPEGALFAFKSELHEFGVDDDGDPVSVNIVSESRSGHTRSTKERWVRWSRAPIRLRSICCARQSPRLANYLRPAITCPRTPRTISVQTWRRYADFGTISESDKLDSKSKAFRRAVGGLQSAGLIGIWNDHAWIVP